MKKTLLLMLYATLLALFTACGEDKLPQNTGPVEEITISQTEAASESPSEATGHEGERMDDETLRQFQSLLDGTGGRDSETWWYNIALAAGTFSSPSELDLYAFFYNGLDNAEITDEEKELLRDAGFAMYQPDYPAELDVQKNPKEEMNAVLIQYFDISLEETDQVGLDDMTYLEETDAFYKFCGDFLMKEGVTVLDGYILEDASVVLCYTSNAQWEGERMLTLLPSGAEAGPAYYIVSNLPA